MGQFASRVHSKEDGKVYNILPLGDMPTVVFGRVIKPNSVPGMQYYFLDGFVKRKDENQQVGYSYVKPFPKGGGKKEKEEKDDGKWGYPCIFTVPEDFDFSRLSDVEYVRQHCKTAIKLNANTMSPDYIIRYGKILCVKQLNDNGYCVVRKMVTHKSRGAHYYKFGYAREPFNKRRKNGKRTFKLFKNSLLDVRKIDGSAHFSNHITLIPIGRTGKKSIYQYKYKKIRIVARGGSLKWNKWIME